MRRLCRHSLCKIVQDSTSTYAITLSLLALRESEAAQIFSIIATIVRSLPVDAADDANLIFDLRRMKQAKGTSDASTKPRRAQCRNYKSSKLSRVKPRPGSASHIAAFKNLYLRSQTFEVSKQCLSRSSVNSAGERIATSVT